MSVYDIVSAIFLVYHKYLLSGTDVGKIVMYLKISENLFLLTIYIMVTYLKTKQKIIYAKIISFFFNNSVFQYVQLGLSARNLDDLFSIHMFFFVLLLIITNYFH